MTQDVLSKKQQELLEAEGFKLREMMKHEGWAVMAKLFKSTVEHHDSTQGIKTLKELLAKQYALAMMNEWMEAVVQRVSGLEHKEAIRRDVHEKMSRSGMVVVSENEGDPKKRFVDEV